MSLIRGRLGAVYIAYGTPATVTDEATTANTAKTAFRITNKNYRFWSDDAVVVKYNGSAVTNYASVQRPGGVVSWAVTPGNAAVLVSGKYYPAVQLGQVKSWSLDVGQEYVDVTCMGDTMKVNMPMFGNVSISIERFYADDTVFSNIMVPQVRVGYDLFFDATGGSESRMTGYGYISSENIKAAVDGMIEEPLQLVGAGQAYFTAGL